MTTTPPVVLFVHGGAFVSGHRNRTEQIYSNVLYYLARNGVAGINIGYRLANDAVYPEATNDIAAAVAWAHEHAAEFGWDPARIFLMGHSAGAAHAGSYAYDPRFRPARGAKIAGMIVVSGRVRVDNLPENQTPGRSKFITDRTHPSSTNTRRSRISIETASQPLLPGQSLKIR